MSPHTTLPAAVPTAAAPTQVAAPGTLHADNHAAAAGQDRPPRTIRQATMLDYPQIQRNYAYARAVMAAHGNPTQWGTVFPREEVVRDDIGQHRTRLLIDDRIIDDRIIDSRAIDSRAIDRRRRDADRSILAQFAVCEGEDPTYTHIEGAWLDDDPYVAIHRIASSGLGRHAARDCLEWAVNRYGNVRIDTHPNNYAMQHVLARCGFTACGRITLLDRDSDVMRLAYQRHDR